MSRTHRRELVTGDYPELELAFMDEVRRLRSTDALAPIVVLVPSNLLRLHLGRLLVDRGTAHLNLRFVTFADLVRPYGKVVDSQTVELLVARACQQCADDFYFERLRGSPGLFRALANSINDLKEAVLEPEQFAAAVRSARGLSGTARRKLSSLLDVWRHYETLKESLHFMDETDLHRAVVLNADRHPLFSNRVAFLAYGLYDFKRVQLQILLALSAENDTTVYFPYEPTPAFEYAETGRAELLSAGFVERSVCRTGAQANPLRFPASVEIVSCPTESAESGEIRRIALGLARTEGVRFWEIGILSRSPAALHGAVRENFESLGARPLGLAGLPLAQTRAGRTLMLLLQAVQDDYARRTLMELLSFADIDWQNLRLDESCASFWDSLSMRAGIVQGRRQWRTRLRALRSRLASEAETGNGRQRTANHNEKLAAIDALIATLDSLLGRLDSIRKAIKWSELVGRVADTFEWLVRPSPPRDAVGSVVRGLSTLAPLLEQCDLGQLAKLVSESLNTQTSPAGDFQQDGPALAGIMQARGVPFRVAMVTGLVERVFPMSPMQDPILLDEERRAINAAIPPCKSAPCPPRLPEKRRQLEEERLLFRLATGAATDQLVLSYSRLEAETGRERIPSQFLIDVAEVLTGRPADYEALFKLQRKVALREQLLDPQRAGSLLEYDVASARRALSGDRGMLLAFCDGTLSRHFAQALHAESRRWTETKLTEFDGLISDPSLLAMLRRQSPLETVISPSRLEDYASCPFYFFMHYLLDLEPIDEPEALTRSNPIAKGEMVHAVLAEFLQRMIDQGRVPIAPDCQADLQEIADRHIREFEESGLAGPGLVWRVECERLQRFFVQFLAREIERQKSQVPKYLEMPFGSDRTPPGLNPNPPELNLGGDQVLRFRGIIDRVDLRHDDPTGIFVIDYKGRRLPELDPDGTGLGSAVQLPIYLLGAELALQTIGNFPRAGGEYVPYDAGPKTRPSALDAPNEESDARLREVLRTIAQGIHGGLFMQYTAGGACDYCDYAAVCMGVQHVIADRKRADPASQPFLEMKSFKEPCQS